jgi:hypothetical protein
MNILDVKRGYRTVWQSSQLQPEDSGRTSLTSARARGRLVKCVGNTIGYLPGHVGRAILPAADLSGRLDPLKAGPRSE